MPILYCRCAYAQVIPDETKDAVLAQLCAGEQPFTAVADLCEMSARRDPRLAELARESGWKIAACHARAVKWLFHAADAPLSEDAHIVNLRELSSTEAVAELTSER
jgi:hypothetical protein